MTSIIADQTTGDIEQNSKSIGYVYQGDKMVYHKYLPAGTILWQSSKVDGTGFSKNNITISDSTINTADDGRIKISVDLSKIKNGLLFDFNTIYYFTDETYPGASGTGIKQYGAGGDYYPSSITPKSKIPLADLQKGYQSLASWNANRIANKPDIKAMVTNNILVFDHGTLLGQDGTRLFFALLKSIKSY